MSATPMMPPTTPPAIALAFVEVDVDARLVLVAVAEVVDARLVPVAVAGAVDSGPAGQMKTH